MVGCADILAQRKEEQKMTALRLHLLGRTSEEIGNVVGLSEGRIRQLSLEFSELKKVTKNLIAEGHPHTDIATSPSWLDGKRNCRCSWGGKSRYCK